MRKRQTNVKAYVNYVNYVDMQETDGLFGLINPGYSAKTGMGRINDNWMECN